MSDIFGESDISRRDVPSFIEPQPPLITNPFLRPRPQRGVNLMEQFEESEEIDLVQVYLRLKPCNIANDLYEVRGDQHLITSLDTTTVGHGRRTQHNVSKIYTFSHIFRDDSTQKEIFDLVVKDNLKRLRDGRSFTLLTYGASGSGKTYTLMGTVAAPGLVPRSLEFLFKTYEVQKTPKYKPMEGSIEALSYISQESELMAVKKLRKLSAQPQNKYRRMSTRLSSEFSGSSFSYAQKYYIWVSFIEIYNEGIYDLLSLTDRRNSSRLAIREDSNGNVYVKGATQIFTRSGEEAYDVLAAGKKNLQIAATGVNDQSSRSHCIFTITIIAESDSGCTTSCVRLCDLAGCERARRTRNTGARMQESRSINSSLHVLERCLHTLRRKQYSTQHTLVPYRESKLTRLLGAGLSGSRGEAVSMVVTLNPSPEYAHETRHVLQLATVARDLQINNTLSEYPSSLESSTQDLTVSGEVMKLRADNERLHFELLQAESRNRELLNLMEENKMANADLMKELVREAQDSSKQFYEREIQRLHQQMAELKEEYEFEIENLKQRRHSVVSTSKYKKHIDELVAENARLKEELIAAKLACARDHEEIQHLRACIDERDEKEESVKEVEELSDLDSDSETDESNDYNESLEPTFKKADINRSRLIRKSLALQDLTQDVTQDLTHDRTQNITLDKTQDLTQNETQDIESSTDSVLDNTSHTLNDTNASACAFVNNIDNVMTCKKASLASENLVLYKNEKRSFFFEDNEVNKPVRNLGGTYCVTKANDSNIEKDNTERNEILDESVQETESPTYSNVERRKYDSLAQFEQLELDTKSVHDKPTPENDFGKNLQKKVGKFFFDDRETNNLNALKDDTCEESHDEIKNYREPSMIKKLFVNNLNKIEEKDTETERKIDNVKSDMNQDDVNKNIDISVRHCKVSNDLFDSPCKINGQDKNKEVLTIDNEDKSVKEIIHTANADSPDTGIVLDTSGPKEINDVENEKNTNNKSDKGEKETDMIMDTVESPQNELGNSAPNDNFTEENALTENDTPSSEETKKITDQIVNNIEKISINDDHQEKLNKDVCKDEEIFKIPHIIDKPINKERSDSVVAIEKPTVTIVITDDNGNLNEPVNESNVNNTIDAFEKIYKDVSIPRPTDFDLLVSQTEDNTGKEVKYNLRKKGHQEKADENAEIDKCDKKEKREKIKKEKSEDENRPKTEVKPRSLRLRRRNGEDKLKDIVNLQSEFCDVTMDMPAPEKVVKDIPSPEKTGEENVSPVYGAQTCPAKSVTRSRRKLFTPKVDALDEDCPQTADTTNEQIRVPRPSYHRPRARRKL